MSLLRATTNKLPLDAQLAAGFVCRALPNDWRFGARFREFHTLARDCEHWSLDSIREFQLKQLRATLIQAGNYVPFYQERFGRAGLRPEQIRSFDDLHRVPLLRRTDLPSQFSVLRESGRVRQQAFLAAQWGRAGCSLGARVLALHETAEGYDPSRGWMFVSQSLVEVERLPELLALAERFRPEVLHASPSVALRLAQILERTGCAWRVKSKCLLCGGERLSIPQKRLLERVFETRVHRFYSSRAMIAGEGHDSELFYFSPAFGYVEFGAPNADGFCELIVTTFHNPERPLIRYRTGEFAKLAHPVTDTRLEFPWPSVAEMVSEREYLIARDGRRVLLGAFDLNDPAFHDLYAIQFAQAEAGRAEFRYSPGAKFHPSRLNYIARAVREKLGDDFEIEPREVIEVERDAHSRRPWVVSSLVA